VNIPNEKISKKINSKINKKTNNNRWLLDMRERDSEINFSNIPIDVNDSEISVKFEDSLDNQIYSIEQENISDPENNLNIAKKVNTYTFNSNVNKNLKPNVS
jgi:hypothetical protein